MSFFKGRRLPLSPSRRLMCDMLYFGQKVPHVTIERRMKLKELASARASLSHRPSWFAIFIHAFGQVARRYEPLRRSYMPFPWPHLYEHSHNVACLAIERLINGEEGVLNIQLRDPEKYSIAYLDEKIRQAKTRPIEEIAAFRRPLGIAWLPRPLRRLAMWSALNLCGQWRERFAGTFAVTGLGGLGGTPIQAITPLTSTLICGAFEPDGSALVRLTFDHRVLDGMVAARALIDMETILHETVLPELLAGRKAA